MRIRCQNGYHARSFRNYSRGHEKPGGTETFRVFDQAMPSVYTVTRKSTLNEVGGLTAGAVLRGPQALESAMRVGSDRSAS